MARTASPRLPRDSAVYCSTGFRLSQEESVKQLSALFSIQDDPVVYDDYDEVKATVMQIKAAVDADGEAPKVPCHNDSLVGNWVLRGDGKLFLIDWEYSGMNLAMWDLSCLSIECAYGPSEDEALLEAYYGRTPSVDERRQLAAAKLYVDYLWTLWGLTRIPYDGEFMQEYADGRYERLKANIEAYRSIA